MQYRKLGRSDLEISVIGFGCMSLPVEKENDSIQLLHKAIELGINYFDTADLYQKGLNETVTGKALASKRNQVIIATKVGNRWRPDGSGWDWTPRKDYIVNAAEESLKRLQTDHIDLYQLHGGTVDDPIDEVIEAFEQLQQQGKIRYYGISSIRPNVIREYVKRSAVTSVMLQYSIADRRPEESILDLLKKNGIAVLCRGALAQGMLAGKPGQEYLGHTAEEMDAAAQLLQGLGIPTRTGAQSALLYVLNHPAVTSVITGVSRMEQLTEIAAAADKEMLTEKHLEMLKNILPPKTYELHR